MTTTTKVKGKRKKRKGSDIIQLGTKDEMMGRYWWLKFL